VLIAIDSENQFYDIWTIVVETEEQSELQLMSVWWTDETGDRVKYYSQD